MDAVPERLRDRIVLLHADLVLGRVDAAQAVWLACDLIVAGVDTPAVVELAGESPTSLTNTDGVPIIRRMLAELGIEPIDPTQAAWLVAHDLARHIVAGTLPSEDGARELWGLWWQCDQAEAIGRMVEFLDAWHATLPHERARREALEADLRELARDVLHAARNQISRGDRPR